MRIVLLTSFAIGYTASANAQAPTVEDLARRVEALERDNAVLRAQIQQMTAPGGDQVRGVPAPPPSVAAPAFIEHAVEPWDHAYVGPNGGYAAFRSGAQRTDAVDRVLTSNGPAFGAQLGRRWQSGTVVTGVELEGNFFVGTENVTRLTLFRLPVEVFPNNEDDLTARGRLKGSVGFSSGSFLGYGIAGLEVSRLVSRFNSPSSTPFGGIRETRVAEQYKSGLLYGLGAAYRLNEGISVEIEVTRSSLGSLVINGLPSARTDSIVVRLNQSVP